MERDAEGLALLNNLPLTTVIKHSSQPFVANTLTGKLLSCNEAFCNLVGYSEQELHAMNVFDLIPSECYYQPVLKVLDSTGKSQRYETEYIHKSGYRIPVEIYANRIINPSADSSLCYYGFITDISERKAAILEAREQQVHLAGLIKESRHQLERTHSHLKVESEKRQRLAKILELFFELSADQFAVTDFKGNIIHANKTIETCLGYTLGEFCSMPLSEYIHRDDLPTLKSKLKRIISDGSHINSHEIRVIGKNGQYKWVDVSVIPDLSEKLLYLVGRDVTERKHMRDQLKKFSNKLYSILESIAHAFFAVDYEWHFTYMNRKAEEINRASRQDVIGQSIWRVFPSIVDTVVADKLRRAMAERHRVIFEAPSILGSNTWYEYHVFPSDEGLSVFVSDITERRQNREQLRQLANIVESSCNAVISCDRQGTILSWNNSAEELFGYTVDEAKGAPISLLVPPERKPEVASYISEVCDKKETLRYEAEVVRKDGRRIHVLVGLVPLCDNVGNVVGFCSISNDITERKIAEQSLKLSKERFSKIFHANPVLMSLRRKQDMVILDVNRYWCQYTKYSREEVIGLNSADLKIIVSQFEKEDRKMSPFTDVKVKYKTKQGDIRSGLLSVRMIEVNGEECILDVMRDITDIEHMEQEMARLDRLDLIGKMAAGISHEIRNPLTTVRGFLQLLATRHTNPECISYFELMIEELDRANSIITNFLALGKVGDSVLRLSNLNEIITKIAPLLQADAVETSKSIELDLQPVPNIAMDNKEIRQLILNLCRNGLEAMNPGGILLLKTFVDRNNLVLTVIDQGNGIPSHIRNKIGTPFFTTKENGTGLGLATCFSIAAKHNAVINIESCSKGTTVTVRFRLQL